MPRHKTITEKTGLTINKTTLRRLTLVGAALDMDHDTLINVMLDDFSPKHRDAIKAEFDKRMGEMKSLIGEDAA